MGGKPPNVQGGLLRPTCRPKRAAKEDAKADVAQLAERVLGKDEVTSSILVIGSNLSSPGVAPASDGWQAS